jgi:hypothetical protein
MKNVFYNMPLLLIQRLYIKHLASTTAITFSATRSRLTTATINITILY